MPSFETLEVYARRILWVSLVVVLVEAAANENLA
jgi:hypothetical protein